MGKYRKKPVVIEAEVYSPGMEDGYDCKYYKGSCEIKTKKPCGNEPPYGTLECEDLMPYINTLEGKHYITKGDYIITGIKGERYPCKPDIFEMTYECIEE